MRAGFIAAALVLLLPACSTPERRPSRARAALPPPATYVRIDNTRSNLPQLQIDLRQFLPRRGPGPAIWLAAVSHVGDTNYFAALQAHLNRQGLVLYEGVGDGSAEPAAAEPAPAGGDHATLQTSLAQSLGLVFQLEAIDYDRPNFRNSDLSIQQLRGLMAAQDAASGQGAPAAGEPGAGESFEALLGAMQGGGWFQGLMQLGLRFVGASPHLQALMKLGLMELIDQIQGDPGRLRNLPPNIARLLNVLIEKRNQRVVADLRTALRRPAPPASITVLYGAAHMPDLERRLRAELAYRPADQVWLTAFSVDLARARVSAAEVQWVRSLVRRQLGPYQPR
jgi:hypothetical protein